MHLLRVFGIYSAAALCLFLAAGDAHAATCPAGQRLTTADDAVVRAGTLKVGVCYNPNDIGIGQTAEQAKEYIYSISTKASTADRAHVEKLNDSFAVCAAMFFKAYSSKYGRLQVTSTWRSADDQVRVSTSPTSNHTRGLAIDVHPSDHNYDQMRDFAKANPQFGVCFARPTYNGHPDLPHMTAAGIGSRTEDCSKQGITKMCDAGHFDSNSIKYAPPASNGTTPPSGGGGSSGAAASLGSGTQSACPTGSVYYNSTCYPLNSQSATSPLSTAQQPFSSANTGVSGQPSTPVSTGTLTQSNSGQGTSQTSASSNLLSTQTTGDAAAQQSSTQKLQDLLKDPASVQTTDLGKSAPLALNQDTHFVGGITVVAPSAGLTSQQQNGSTEASGAPTPLSATQPSVAQETFTGAGKGIGAVSPPASESTLSSTLGNLKQALLRTSSYLGTLRSSPTVNYNLPQPKLVTSTTAIEFVEGGE